MCDAFGTTAVNNVILMPGVQIKRMKWMEWQYSMVTLFSRTSLIILGKSVAVYSSAKWY